MGNDVAVLLEKLGNEKEYIGHVNGGTHGGRDGSHAGGPGQLHPSDYAEVMFTKEDMDTIVSIRGYASFHQVTSYSGPIYPDQAAYIVNAWCYSDGKHEVQPGNGISGCFCNGQHVWHCGTGFYGSRGSVLSQTETHLTIRWYKHGDREHMKGVISIRPPGCLPG